MAELISASWKTPEICDRPRSIRKLTKSLSRTLSPPEPLTQLVQTAPNSVDEGDEESADSFVDDHLDSVVNSTARAGIRTLQKLRLIRPANDRSGDGNKNTVDELLIRAAEMSDRQLAAAVAEHSSYGAGGVKRLLEARVCRRVISSMICAPTDLTALQEGCIALTMLAADHTIHINYFGSMGACEAVVHVLSMPSANDDSRDNNEVKDAVLSALVAAALLAQHNDNRLRMDKAGLCSTLIPLFSRYPDRKDHQAWCCKLVFEMAGRLSTCTALAQAGAPQAIVKSLNSNLDSPDVLEWGCAALASLSARKQTAELVLKAGAAETLVQIMNRTSNKAGKVESSNILQHACRAICGLTTARDGSDALVKAGVCQALHKCLTATSEGAVLAWMCRAVFALSEKQLSASGGLLVEVGACQSVVAGIRRCNSDKMVVEEGCAALYSLSRQANGVAELKKSISMIEGVLTRFPNEKLIQLWAKKALRQINMP